MNKKWIIKSIPETGEIERLQNELNIDGISAKLLLQRDIKSKLEAEKFFRPTLGDLYDPFLMKDMDRAVERINKAINDDEQILLLGDYDVDGTTAVALMILSLKDECNNISFYIPDRYSEGYGISKQGIDFASENDFSLIISLDCGIKSVELINYAKEKEIDFIICDHHQPGETIPDCIVLDPKQTDCNYPFKELSGCGVGFKFLQALYLTNNWDHSTLFQNLDLVAISIGADIVPVIDENRILAKFGLKQLNNQPRTAFKELIESSGKKFPLTLSDVVFTIAPRINAAGRLRSGTFAVELMISNNHQDLVKLAEDINIDNLNRRGIDTQITEEAIQQIESNEQLKNSKSTVVYHPEWHKGVVGIVASRLIEKYYKPTIVLTKSNGMITGSARSIANFNLYEALEACADLLSQFGGHSHAAGLTLEEENLNPFIAKFESEVCKRIDLSNHLPIQEIDLELNFGDIFQPTEDRMKIPRLKKILDHFEPHGPGNMKPVFLAQNIFSKEARILKEKHLKLNIAQPDCDVALDAIGFNLAEKELLTAKGIPYQLAFTMETNIFREKETLQLNVKDIREIV
jgi:single-stranded-DNA-specific exonuclease